MNWSIPGRNGTSYFNFSPFLSHYPQIAKSLLNLLDYLENEYPKLTLLNSFSSFSRIRPLYVFEKVVATFGTFALLYTVTESFILPLTPSPDQPFIKSLLDLALPFMVAYLLLFFIIFGMSLRYAIIHVEADRRHILLLECICNGFAELS